MTLTPLDARPAPIPTPVRRSTKRRPGELAQTLDRIDNLVNTVPCRQGNADEWFSKSVQMINRAKRACQGCPVREACLRAALDMDDRNGVWGGLDERERRELKRRLTSYHHQGVAA